MKSKLFFLSILMVCVSCNKNNKTDNYKSENENLKKKISDLNEAVRKYQDTVSSYNMMFEDYNNENASNNNTNAVSGNFDCDNPELMSLVQDRIQTKIQNVMTVSVNNELKTCDCEAYLPNKRVVLYRENKKNGAFTDHYKQGATFKYKAQLKEDGQILFNGNIE